MKQTLPTLPENLARARPAEADGPERDAGFGALQTTRGCLPLRTLGVLAQIDGLLARVELTETFVNVHAEPLEATYIFPLPDRAAVTRFRLEVAGRVIEGVLKERGQARQEYTEAIHAGHRAAITEEERPGVFALRVGNLPPGESATVRLTLAGPLPYSDGEATFRFPLVVAPRYIPGNTLPGPSVGAGTAQDTDAVPDASRISPPVLLPGFLNPVRLQLAVEFVPSELTPRDLRSSLHAVLEENGRGRRVTLEPGERLDRDFILRFRLAEGVVRSALSLEPDEAGPEGTFALTLVPPAVTGTRARDVVFVLDRSGSMGGWKMTAARRALGRMVDSLTDTDRFAVLVFDDRVETPPGLAEGLVPASDRNRFRAVEFLGTVESRGGTEMAQPLSQAGRLLAGEPERDRVLVLVTDGQVGNEDQILRTLRPHLKGVRVFALGIDQAVNAGFLKRLADLGGGACELVESEDRLDERMEAIHRRVGTPVLSGLKLEPAGLNVLPGSVTPTRMPDLFAGAPVVILGRYRGSPEGALTVQARAASGELWSAPLRAEQRTGTAASAVWARGRLRDLEDLYVVGTGDRPALEREIIATSLRFGVLCRFTAYLAVDRAEKVHEGGKGLAVVQPVETPAGWDPHAANAAAVAPSGGMRARRAGAMKSILPSATLAAPAARPPASPPPAAPAPVGADSEFDLSVDESASFGRDKRALQDADQNTTRTRGVGKSRSESRPGREQQTAKGESWLRRLIALFVGAPSSPFDLGPYRPRAEELLRLLAGSAPDATARLALLRSVADRLEALFAELTGAGSRLPEVQRLGEAALAVQELLAENAPPDATTQVVWDRLRAALHEIARTVAPAERGAFWK